MFKSIDYNALDREFWPGKPLSRGIRRRMFFLYLSGEGPREISLTVRGLSLKQGTGNRRMGMGNGERGTGNL